MREIAHCGARAGSGQGWTGRLRFAGVFALLTVAACGHQDVTDKSIADLRADITRVAADRDRLEERVVALERAEQTRTDAETAATTSPAIASPDPPRMPAARAGTSDARPSDGDGSQGSRAAKMSGDPKRDFDAAVALARSKQFDRAIDGLTAFLVRYPDHEYVDQAMYVRGDCLYAKGANARAVDQLQGLIARFPQSPRVPDAMLKLGLLQRRSGSEDQAQRTFADLKQRFPKSDAVRQVPRP
jgi:tol-pal system protein YbgF